MKSLKLGKNLIIIFVAVILITAVSGCGKNPETPAPVATTATDANVNQTTTPEQTAADDAQNIETATTTEEADANEWKTYKDDLLNFSFKYNDDFGKIDINDLPHDRTNEFVGREVVFRDIVVEYIKPEVPIGRGGWILDKVGSIVFKEKNLLEYCKNGVDSYAYFNCRSFYKNNREFVEFYAYIISLDGENVHSFAKVVIGRTNNTSYPGVILSVFLNDINNKTISDLQIDINDTEQIKSIIDNLVNKKVDEKTLKRIEQFDILVDSFKFN